MEKKSPFLSTDQALDQVLNKKNCLDQVWELLETSDELKGFSISDIMRSVANIQETTGLLPWGHLWAIMITSYEQGILTSGFGSFKSILESRAQYSAQTLVKIMTNLVTTVSSQKKISRSLEQFCLDVMNIVEEEATRLCSHQDSFQLIRRRSRLQRLFERNKERHRKTNHLERRSDKEKATGDDQFVALSEEAFETQMQILATNGKLKEMTQYYRENVRSVIAGHSSEKESLLFLLRFGHSFFEILETLHHHQFSSEHHQLSSQIEQLSDQLVFQMKKSGQTIEEQELAETGVLPGSHAHEMAEKYFLS